MADEKTPAQALEELKQSRIDSYRANKVDVSDALNKNRARLNDLPRDIFSGNDLVGLANLLDEALKASKLKDPLQGISALQRYEQQVRQNYVVQLGLDSVGKLPDDRNGIQRMIMEATMYFNDKNGYERE